MKVFLIILFFGSVSSAGGFSPPVLGNRTIEVTAAEIKNPQVYSEDLLVYDDLNAKFLGVTFSYGAFAWAAGEEFKFSRQVKYAVGNSYGWVLNLKTNKKSVFLKEVLTLPAPSSEWTVGEGQEILEGGKVAVTKRTYTPGADGTIYSGWGFTKSDPKGEYRLDVYYKERLIYTIRFEVW